MINFDTTKAVQWTDESGAHHVGKCVLASHEHGLPKAAVWDERTGNYLIAHVHTGEFEFVNPEILSPYPSEPITIP